MWDRARYRRPGPVQHSLLPGGDAVRHLRRRDRVHVSLGGDLRQAVALWADRDDCLHFHSGCRLLLRVAKRRTGMGLDKPADAEPLKPPAPKPENPAAARPAGAPHAAHPPAAAPPSGPPDQPPPPNVTVPPFIESLRASIPGGISALSYWVGDWTIIIPVSYLLDVARHVRDAPDASFDYCSDVTATDWPPRAERFDVVYCLYSTRHRHRVRIKAKVGEHQPIPSV